jgi:uncharacterized integral membrane protein
MADDARNPPESRTPQDLGRTLRLIAAAVLVLITVGLVLDNRRDVRIGWVLGDVTTPLAFALILTFLLGLVVGWLGAHRRRD